MVKILFLEILFLLHVSSLLCQTIIKGDIRTNKNQLVIGANIYFKGTIEGTNSDEQGRFLLSTNLTGNKILVVSCIGYKTHEEPVKLQNNTTELSITIFENDVELNEVTVYAGTPYPGRAIPVMREVCLFVEGNRMKQKHLSTD